MAGSRQSYPTWAKYGILPTVSTGDRRTSKPSWEIARDISMDLLSRRATKLSIKQGSVTSSLTNELSSTGKDVTSQLDRVYRSSNATRFPRMPSEEQALLSSVTYNSNCSSCNDTCIDSYLRCRNCVRVYHLKCLYVRGYMSASFTLPRTRKLTWSCPECRDLTRLLSEHELHYLIQAFDYIDRNHDGLIILDEYLSIDENETLPSGFELFIQHNPELGRQYFRLMDTRQTGAISWSDFAVFYSCKLLVAKNKTDLAMKLTDKELVRARTFFFKDPRKTFDDNRMILVTREHLRDVCDTLVESLKEKFDSEFLDVVLDYDRDYEKSLSQPMMLNWEEFLRETAIFFLLDRFHSTRNEKGTVRPGDVRSNDGKKTVETPKSPPNSVKSSSRTRPSRSQFPSTRFLPNIFYDESFRKHAKILEKLRQNEEDENVQRRQFGSVLNYSIVESLDEVDDEKLPKLKCHRRDDRNAIVDPWTAVKDLQQLRTQSIPIKAFSSQLLH